MAKPTTSLSWELANGNLILRYTARNRTVAWELTPRMKLETKRFLLTDLVRELGQDVADELGHAPFTPVMTIIQDSPEKAPESPVEALTPPLGEITLDSPNGPLSASVVASERYRKAIALPKWFEAEDETFDSLPFKSPFDRPLADQQDDVISELEADLGG